MEKIKIVHSVRNWLLLTEGWIYEQVKNQKKYENFILANKCTEKFPSMKYLDDRVSFKKRSFYNKLMCKIYDKLYHDDYFRLKCLKDIGNPIVLYSHFGTIGYEDLRLPKLKHITRFYGFDVNLLPKSEPVWQERYKKLFENCHGFLAEGPHMGKLLNGLGCPQEKIHIHHLGTNLSATQFILRKFSGDAMNILLASTFREKKGLIYALEALGICLRDYGMKNIRIHLVGNSTGFASSYGNKMERCIEKYELEKNIKRYGIVSKETLQEIAGKCHFCIQPSVWAEDGDCEGGYPVIIPDLMATGLPIIATNHCDIPEVVNNDNGYICREKNVDDIINAIRNFVIKDTLSRKSKNAREHIENNFDWKNLGIELEAVIDKILCGERG